MPDGICAHGDCLVDEPIKLVERRVKGSDHTEVYCDRHDPLEDPRVADHFEAVA